MVELLFADGGLSAPCSFNSIRPATTKSRSIYYEDKARGLEVVSISNHSLSFLTKQTGLHCAVELALIYTSTWIVSVTKHLCVSTTDGCPRSGENTGETTMETPGAICAGCARDA